MTNYLEASRATQFFQEFWVQLLATFLFVLAWRRLNNRESAQGRIIMNVSVIGTGYVGLVAGACLSDTGNHVSCIDVDEKKIANLQKGEIPIFEPGLEEIVTRNVQAKRLEFLTEGRKAIEDSDVVFIAVGTPAGEDGSSDLRYVLTAVQTVCDTARHETILVLKSTVPVGTSAKVKELVKSAAVEIHVVSNPEFLKEGTAVGNFLKPERVVIGTESIHARQIMAELYGPFVRSGNPILFMSNESAEMSKYAANAFLAAKISFINELACLAEKVGADIHEVRKALVTDSRIGAQFLYPGCGYGGSCFPKDVLALIDVGKTHGVALEFFRAVHAINERQKQVLYGKIKSRFNGELQGRTIAVWGLAFKPMTDDMREAPSVTLINALLAAGTRVRAYDPVAENEARRIFADRIELNDDPYNAAEGADGLAILTEWNEFRTPDFPRLKRALTQPVIFDGRNLYNPESVRRHGFHYHCIGRRDPA
jgi:UDPglucose 6-dehydrogenase